VSTWVILRAAGIGAYLMLWASIAWGLASTTTIMGKRAAKASTTLIHQFFSTVGLLLLVVHVGLLLVDRFIDFGWVDVLVPMTSPYRPFAVALGVLAMYATVVILATSWTRKKIGTLWWRRFHVLAIPAFALTLLHGVFSGTDTLRSWTFWMYLSTTAILLFLTIVRGLTARPERAARPAAGAAARPAAVPATRRAAEPAPEPSPHA
jgi:predicted ferric reductase